jgi:predicted O-methyltransferase YrrM
MLDTNARAVLTRLEEEDARERRDSIDRSRRLRQITPEVGSFLHTLALATRPDRILEIGTSGGYSTIWLATAARALGATVTTVEIDPAKIRRAAPNIAEAGVSDTVTVVEGDAFEYLALPEGSFQFVFLDAEKEDYEAFLERLVGILPVGGLIVADNLTSHADELAGFRERALSHPLLSSVVVPIGRGELLAVKTG